VKGAFSDSLLDGFDTEIILVTYAVYQSSPISRSLF